MKLTKINHVEDFLAAANECTDDVILVSRYGDKYNLNSRLSQYIAIGALLGENGDELELFCSNRADEQRFMKFFKEHSEVLN